MTRRFKLRLWLAKYLGAYRYDGCWSFAGIRGYPLARVKYPDGEISAKMALGNAVEYRNIFGGTVIEPDLKKEHHDSSAP